MAQHVGVFPSKERTATHSSPDIRNYGNGVGLVAVIDCTSITDTPSVTFTIEGKDPSSGKYYTILTSAAVASVSTVVLRVHPDLTAAANLVAKDMLPAVWRVTATHGDTDAIIYSVGASVI